MSWEWSHAPEAYADLRESLACQPREWLEVCYAEWKGADGGHFAPRHLSFTSALFGLNERRYQRALSAARYLSTDDMAERIYAWSERQSLCTNGGHKANCCPYGCRLHELAWDEWKEKEESEFENEYANERHELTTLEKRYAEEIAEK